MRLITWNCQGALHRKHPRVASLRPDILVVPECAEMTDISVELGADPIRTFIWKGDNPNKGIGIVSYGDYSLNLHYAYDPRFRLIIPLEVAGPESFVLVAVWMLRCQDTRSYVEHLLRAYEYYRTIFRGRTVIWAGDFNASVRFDPELRQFKFADFISMAEADQIQSMYHRQNECAHGDESDGTFFMNRHADKKHHIDYVFASKELLDSGFEVDVGSHQDWMEHSDHMPLICDFHDFSK